MSNTTNRSENQPKDDNQLSAELKENNKVAGQKNDDENFPGYPHYPPQEDIMSAARQGRVDVDVENLPKRGSQVNVDLKEGMPAPAGSAKDEPAAVGDMDDDVVIVPGTDADVTKEDLELLEGDFNDGDTPLNRVKLDRVDEEVDDDEDLDIPGSEIDDANESIGEEDEENNYYSLGGDAHEDLEEDKS